MDLHAQNNQGHTPLYIAVESGYFIMRVLSSWLSVERK
ncbi:hypothetical protein PRO82_000535 [Candidatus Protochlamydia amoebophila]|nr:hypothetical protein [Candidatus Protochlamydia amoebophila]